MQDGRPYHQTSYSTAGILAKSTMTCYQNLFLIVLAVAVVIILLLIFLYYDCWRPQAETEQEGTRGGGESGDRVDQPLQQLESNEAGGGWDVGGAVASTMVAGADVEMAPGEPPLVCTYRKADGWQEGSCGVCLAELDDGEAVRVLPACMHYFHAACVAEWLRIHATCPLCRAALVAPADAV